MQRLAREHRANRLWFVMYAKVIVQEGVVVATALVWAAAEYFMEQPDKDCLKKEVN